MELKGSKTEANLLAAFAGESMARNRYTFYAYKAEKEGFEQIAGIFHETAENEKEHAEMIFKYLKGVGNTADNLKAGAEGEHEEWAVMYKEMEQVAREEGFTQIANFFKHVAEVEAEHEERYLKLLERVNQHTVFVEDNQVKWKCRNCGYVYVGIEPPEVCPACFHPRAYFERKAENY